MGTNINGLFEEIAVKLLERHHTLNPNAKKLKDPGAQNLSFNYNKERNSHNDGLANNIVIVDISK